MSHTSKNPPLKYTTSDLPSNSPVGTLAYDKTEDAYKSFNGSSWNKLEGGIFGSSSYFIFSDDRIDTVYGDIADSNFLSSLDLDTAIIGSSCTKIGNQAFASSSISKIIIPSTVKEIGSDVFTNCNFDSDDIRLPEGLETIGTFAFFNFSILNQSIDIPSTVSSMGAGTFNSSNITNLNCYVEYSVINNNNPLLNSSVSTIHARSTDSTWTAGSGQTIGGKTGITVIKDL